MKPYETKRLRKILERMGCVKVGTVGSHEKWMTPGGLTNTIVAGEKTQSPGLLRNIQTVFAPEFGPKWLEKEMQR